MPTKAEMDRCDLNDRIVAIERRLLNARMCWAGGDRIAERATEINKTRHKAALGSIQNALENLAIIQTSALFDDSKRNKTHSLPQLVAALRGRIPIAVTHLQKKFAQFGSVPESEAMPAFFEFAEMYRNPPLSEALLAVRARRDQVLAHFDQTPAAHELKYDHVDKLLDHCRIALRMAATAFTGRIVGPDDELLVHMSLHSRGDLKRMISALIDGADNSARSRKP